MLGLRLFIHSVRMVFKNWKGVFRVWFAPMVVAGLAYALLAWGMADVMNTDRSGAKVIGILTTLLAFITIWICVLWGIVSWHRYILLDEPSFGIVPPIRRKEMLRYVGRGILISLILGITAMPLMIVVVPFAQSYLNDGNFAPLLVANTGLSVLFSAAFFCMSPSMVASALGNKVSIGEALARTFGKASLSILFAAILLLAATAVINAGFVQIYPMLPHPVWTVLSFPISAVYGLVGVSLLTTIYGHFIEDRPLG